VRKGVAGDSKSSGSSAWWTMLTSLLPFVLLFGFWIFLVNRRRDQAPNEDIAPDVTNG
jgi:ATP-dependent Zn protease